MDLISESLQTGILSNREKNLTVKREILDELEVINQDRDWVKSFPRVKELQQRWIKIGRLSDAENEQKEVDFKSKIDLFFEQREKHQEGIVALSAVRVDKLRSLVSEAQGLSKQDVWKGASKFKSLQAEWKKMGFFPGDERKELQNQFQNIAQEFFAKLKTSKVEREKDKTVKRGEIEVVKNQLLERARLLLAKELEESIEEAKTLQGEWKKTGFLSSGKMGEMQNEFFLNCDKVFEMAYVVKIAKAKFQDFDSLGLDEQNKMKSVQLRKLIERDKNELAIFEDNLSNLQSIDAKSSFRNVIKSRLSNQQRKLKAKQSLLEDLLKI